MAARVRAKSTKAASAGVGRTVVGYMERHHRVGSFDLQRNSVGNISPPFSLTSVDAGFPVEQTICCKGRRNSTSYGYCTTVGY